MSYAVASLESRRGQTVADQFRLLDAWAAREAIISLCLHQSLSDEPDGPTPLDYARRMVDEDELPRGMLTGTVYYRERNGWSEEAYMEMGIVLRSLDAPEDRPAYAELCVPVADDEGEYEYIALPHVEQSCADLVGSLATGRIAWASLRNLALTPDTTGLVLPNLQTIQAVESAVI